MLAGDFVPGKIGGTSVGRTNEESFLSTKNNFETFLGTKEDLPRYSILSNYG